MEVTQNGKVSHLNLVFEDGKIQLKRDDTPEPTLRPPLSCYGVNELVDELMKRGSVDYLNIDRGEVCTIGRTPSRKGDPRNFLGPSLVLVVDQLQHQG
jgi:hypothetical protein